MGEQETKQVSQNPLVTMASRYLDPLDIGLIIIVIFCLVFSLFLRVILSLIPHNWYKQTTIKKPPKNVAISTTLPHQTTTTVVYPPPLAAALMSPSHQQTTSSSSSSSIDNSNQMTVSSTLLAAAVPILTTSPPQITATTISHVEHPPLSRTPGEHGHSGTGGNNNVTLSQLAAIEKTSLDWLNTALIWMHTYEIGIFSASALRQWFEAMNAEAANLAAQNRHHGLTIKFRELSSSDTPPIITSVMSERVVDDQDVKRSLLIGIEWREFSLPLLVCRDEDLLAVPISGDMLANAKELEQKMYSVTMLVRSIRAGIRITVEPMAETGEVYLTLVYAHPPDMIFDVKPTANAEFPYHINLIHLSELLDMCVRTTSVRVCVKQSTLFDPSTGGFFSMHQMPARSSYWTGGGVGSETPRSRGSISDDSGHINSITSPRTTPKKPPRLANKQQMLVKIVSASFNYMLPTMQRQKNNLAVMDSYCVIETEPPFEKQITSIVQNSASPFWDEHFVVYIDDLTTTLILNLHDNLQRDGNDSLIGAVRIDIDQIRCDPELFRQPIMMDILANVVESSPSNEPGGGVVEEERAVIVGQLTLAAEILLPQNEIRRRGSFFRESVPKEENPPLPSSVVFPKHALPELPVSITPPMSLSGGGTSSILNATTATLNTAGTTSQSRLSVSSSATGDASRMDLSVQPTIPENMTMSDQQQTTGGRQSWLNEPSSSTLQYQPSVSSRSRTIKITVPKLSTVIDESKSLMRKPTVAKLKKNINTFQNWTMSKIEKAGGHLQEPIRTPNNVTPPPPDLLGASSSTAAPLGHHKERSLKARIMATLHNLQHPHSNRALSADRGSEFFSKKKQTSTLAIGSPIEGTTTSTSSRPRSPKFFTERLSKTAKSLSTSLRKLIVDIQTPLTSCAGGSGRSRAAKHRRGQIVTNSLRDNESPTVIMPDMVSGISRGSTPSELEFSTVAPASPGRFHHPPSTVTGSDEQESENADSPMPSSYEQADSFDMTERERKPSLAALTASSMASRFQGGQVVSSKHRASLMQALTAAEVHRLAQFQQQQHEQQQQQRNLPPPALRNRLNVPGSETQESPTTARRARATGGVTFSPAPFRKTRDGYEQATL